MPLIRFLSPDQPQLVLDAVPARFVDGVCDVNDTDTERVSRMRYLGAPFGVIEIGAVAVTGPLTLAAVADAVSDPASAIGAAVRAAVPTNAGVDALRDDLAQLKQQVAALTESGGSRVVFGTTIDAATLADGTLVALLSADPYAL